MKKAYMIILSLLIALGSSAFAGTNYIGRLVFSDGLNEGMKSGTNYTDSISRLLRNDLQTDTYFQRISFGEFSQVQGKEGLGELGEVHVVVHGDGVTVFSTEQDGSLKGGLYYLTTSNDVYDVCNLKLTDGTIVPFNKGRIETVCFCEATHTWAAGDVFAGSASSYSKNDQIFISTDGINWEVHDTNIPKSAFYKTGWRGFSCDENGRWILGRYDAAGQGASNFEPLFYSTDNLKTFKYDKDIPAFYASARGRRGFTGYTTVFDEVIRVWFDGKGNINHKFLTKAEIRPRSETDFSVTGASACNGAIIFTSRGVGSRFVIYEDIDRFEEFIEEGFTLGGVNSIDGYFYCTKRNGSEILMTVDGHSFEVAGDIGLGISGKTRMLCRVGNKVYAGDKKLRVADVFASSNAHSWLREDAGTLTNSTSFCLSVKGIIAESGDNYVPYTGAKKHVQLGEHHMKLQATTGQAADVSFAGFSVSSNDDTQVTSYQLGNIVNIQDGAGYTYKFPNYSGTLTTEEVISRYREKDDLDYVVGYGWKDTPQGWHNDTVEYQSGSGYYWQFYNERNQKVSSNEFYPTAVAASNAVEVGFEEITLHRGEITDSIVLKTEIPIISNLLKGKTYDASSEDDMKKLLLDIAKELGASIISNSISLTLSIPSEGATVGLGEIATQGEFSVDWGDGTVETELVATPEPHTYVKGGDYRIDLCGGIKKIDGDVYGSITNGFVHDVSDPSVSYVKFVTANPQYPMEFGDFAFWKSDAKYVKFSTNVTSIGNQCFSYCKDLERVEFASPSQIKEIGVGCFYCCSNLVEVVLPDSVETLGTMCFAECVKLESLSLPEHIETIGQDCFRHLNSIKRIDVYCSLNRGQDHQSAWCFRNIHSPCDVYIHSPCTNIGYNSFYEVDGMRNLFIGSSVKSLGINSFVFSRALTNVVFESGSNLEYIGGGAFNRSESLKNLEIPNGVKYFGGILTHSALTASGIKLPDSIEYLGALDLSNYKTTTSFELPKNVKIIDGTFNGWRGLQEITIPKYTEEINSSAFDHCNSLTNIVFEEGCTNLHKIGEYAFRCIRLEKFVCPSNVTEIGHSAFQFLRGFSYTNSLKEIDLPSSVTMIGWDAFDGLENLQKLIVRASIPPSCDDLRFGLGTFPKSCKILVPAQSVNTYKNDSFWKIYSDQIDAIQE